MTTFQASAVRQVSEECTLIGSLAGLFGDGFDWRPHGAWVEFTRDGMSLVTVDGVPVLQLPKRVVEIPRSKWMGPLEPWHGFVKTGHWCFEDELGDIFERFY